MALRFERLEDRRMLASDMGEITGTVLNDLQNDGNTANDVVAVGVPVSLFLDGNGNGTFDGAATDAQVGSTVNTDASGNYSFAGLSEGTYFVRVAPGTGLQVGSGGNQQIVTFSAAEAMGTAGTPIDGFTTAQSVSASPPLPSSDPDFLNDAAVLGGERDLFVELTAGTDIFTSVELQAGGGLLRLASSPGVTGNATIVYDGDDDDATVIDFTGLGGADLTTSGGNTMTGISLTIGADQLNSQITLRFYTNATDFTEFQVTVPQTTGGLATEEVTIHFTDTPSATGGAGATFSNIGALAITFEGVTAVDGQIALIGLIGNTTRNADFTVLNEMSLGDRVFADIDNDGLFDPGETGIAGVDLTLYFDTDGSGDFSAGDLPTGDTATTDADGLYLFTGLAPGDYLVQVNESEFQAGQPLSGLASSTGNDTGGLAPDPDDDVNNDDNGTPVTSNGVFSRAITLLGNGEPTNDGDSDNNSNLSVDFGFFGFDLVIDKQVSDATINPGGQLTYTILVTNNGPSLATNVELSDVLPANVTFVSGSKNVGDGLVQEAAGTVTSNLGNLASMASATVTIIASVNNSATGTLTNNVSVTAPNELNTTNNSSSAVTTINPLIDLVLTKVDDDGDQPVSPNGTIVYTINVTNNGPSSATGVVVADTLPSNVTFNTGASTAPASNNGGLLTYNLGSIASGASSQIIVSVTVNPGFTGTLTNTAVVNAAETETDQTNNNGSAQSMVVAQVSSIAGNVFVDTDNDGVFDAGETPIAGVTVLLTGIDFNGASVSQTLQTLADGSYRFTDLLAGTYRVQETQPAFFGDGTDSAGSAGGTTANDDLSQIVLGAGVDAVNYNFGELPPLLSKRSFLASSL